MRPPLKARDVRDVVELILEGRHREELAKKRPEVYADFLNRRIVIEPIDERRVQEGVVTKIRFRVKKGKTYKDYSTGVDPRNPLASITFRSAGQPKRMETNRLRLMAILAVHEMLLPKHYRTGKTETVIGHSANLLRVLKARKPKA